MLNRANREAVVPIVVVLRVDPATVEVQVPCVAGRVERGRPEVAVRAAIVPRRAVAVARASEEKLSATTLHDDTKGLHKARPKCIFDFSHHCKQW
jgi:hypothetical protein